jgi:hypothetical protein
MFELEMKSRTLSVVEKWVCFGILPIGLLLMPAISLQSSAADADRRSLIPSQLRSALGCNLKLRGNGMGPDSGQDEMIDGYFSRSPRSGSASSVFWCAQEESKILLVFTRNAKLMHEECSPLLVWHAHPLAPLSLSDRSEDLREFTYVDDINRAFSKSAGARQSKIAHRTGPSGERTSGMIIQDGDDSLMNQFYCYKGAWLVRRLD